VVEGFNKGMYIVCASVYVCVCVRLCVCVCSKVEENE
jgi:hypothetical protein